MTACYNAKGRLVEVVQGALGEASLAMRLEQYFGI